MADGEEGGGELVVHAREPEDGVEGVTRRVWDGCPLEEEDRGEGVRLQCCLLRG